MTTPVHARPISERIDWLMELSRAHSASFCSPENHLARQRYLAEHNTQIIAMKCMDGRIHLPYVTQTPLGVIHPFRNLGGIFELGWPYLGDMLADTPLAKIDDIEFVRTVAVARICMPMSMVRLSAGRESMSAATQALCFLAGANSIFTGDRLLTAPNAGDDEDAALFARLGLKALQGEEPARACRTCEAAE